MWGPLVGGMTNIGMLRQLGETGNPELKKKFQEVLSRQKKKGAMTGMMGAAASIGGAASNAMGVLFGGRQRAQPQVEGMARKVSETAGQVIDRTQAPDYHNWVEPPARQAPWMRGGHGFARGLSEAPTPEAPPDIGGAMGSMYAGVQQRFPRRLGMMGSVGQMATRMRGSTYKGHPVG